MQFLFLHGIELREDVRIIEFYIPYTYLGHSSSNMKLIFSSAHGTSWHFIATFVMSYLFIYFVINIKLEFHR